MFNNKFLAEMVSGLKQIGKLHDMSKGAIEYAKCANVDVVKIWLAKAIHDLCGAHKLDVKEFADFVTGDFNKMYEDVKSEKKDDADDFIEKIMFTLGIF